MEISDDSKKEIENKTISNCSGHIGIDEVYDNKDGIVFITDLVNDLILTKFT